MLHIILMILAGAGKILLGIIGCILLLILLILFVPIRYRGTFRKEERKMQGEAEVSWLLKLALVRTGWKEGSLSYEIRILGIPVLKLLERRKNRKKESEEPSGEETKEESLALPEQPADNPAAEEPVLKASEEGEEDPQPDPDKTQEVPAESENNSGNLLHKIKSIFGKIRGIFGKIKNLQDQFKGAASKAEKLLSQVRRVMEFLQSDLFRQVFEAAKRELTAIIRHILPRTVRGEVDFGAEDPGTTGEILAGIAMIYPMLPKHLHIRPDFENRMFDCDLTVKGRIRTAVLLFHGVRLLLNKQVRQLISKVRHKEA